MSVTAAVLRELIAAGLSGDALTAAVERIELADMDDRRATRAARNRRYQERLKARKATAAVDPAPEPKTLKTSYASYERSDKTLKTSQASYSEADKTPKTSQPSYDAAAAGSSPEKKVSPDPSKNPTPISTPSDPLGSSAPKPKAARGCRIPGGFEQSPAARSTCADFGLSEHQADEALAEFHDYWVGVPGDRGLKLDWPATLRNWLRRTAKRGSPPQRARPPPYGRAPTAADAAAERSEFLHHVMHGGSYAPSGHHHSDDHRFGRVIEHQSDQGSGGEVPWPAGGGSGQLPEEGLRRIAGARR